MLHFCIMNIFREREGETEREKRKSSEKYKIKSYETTSVFIFKGKI